MKVLICDFDFFSTVGGGQMFYRRIVERNSRLSFSYPSRGSDMTLKSQGALPDNARPFIISQTAGTEIQPALGSSMHCISHQHAGLLAATAAAVQGESFDVADMPSFFPAAHLARPIFTSFGVSAERIVLAMLGWNSVSCRASYDDLGELAAVYEAEEVLCANAADIRYTISQLEQTRHARASLPVQQVDMHDFLEEFQLPEPEPPGSGAPNLWYVGRLDGAKGPDLFIELVARMPRDRYRNCYLTGPDNHWDANARWSEHVLNLARQRGVDATYLGTMSDAEVRRRAYGGRSVIVVPSRTDSFNYVALEAVLNGCPVLLSSKTGASGFMAGDHPAILPPIMNPDDLDDAAHKLLGILRHYPDVARTLRRRLRDVPFPPPRRHVMAEVYGAPPRRAAEADARATDLTTRLRSSVPLMLDMARAVRPVRPASLPTPRVSIIIPTLDRPEFLAPTLASLARQTLQDFEIIVVDDGSADARGLKQLVDSFSPLARLKRIGNCGEAGAVNRGLNEVRGEFVGILSDDDTYHPELLERAVEALESCGDVLAVYPDWEMIDSAGHPMEEHELPDFDRRLMLRAHWCLPSVGAIVRRSAVTRIGGRDTSFRFVSDFDFWLRLSAHGPLLHLPRKLAVWRWHGANLTTSAWRREMADERIRLIDRLFADPDEAARSAADRPAAYAAAHLCAAALVGKVDAPRALLHLSAAARLDRDLCENLPLNMSRFPRVWPEGYKEALRP